MILWSWEVPEGVVAVAEGATLGEVAVALTEEVAEGWAVELPVAAAWKAANLSPGLMAKTMPF